MDVLSEFSIDKQFSFTITPNVINCVCSINETDEVSRVTKWRREQDSREKRKEKKENHFEIMVLFVVENG